MHEQRSGLDTHSIHFSVVVPTYQRRDVVLQTVRALGNQAFADAFEVVVVVDGSRDGSATALAQLELSFPLRVVEQQNRGLAAARNRGAAEAKGELLLFLDDDMEAHPSLLLEHDRSQREGADVVLGHVPLHRDSPSNFLSAAVGAWAETRARSLSAPGATLGIRDLIGGQMSLRRDLFWQLGGFDTDFTRGGTFGNEDLDFGHRLAADGRKIVFNVDAVSWQRYIVTPRHYLRQWRESGRAAVMLARKHPDQIDAIVGSRKETFMDRAILRWLRRPARVLVLLLARVAPRAGTTSRCFFRVRGLEYFQGIREAGGIPARWPVRVLCYHALSDLAAAPVMESYGVPPKAFEAQLDVLGRHFRFIEPDEFLRFLDGGGVPRRAVLLTFDDSYQDLVDVGLPLLRARSIPALAFAVTERLGGSNDWDEAIGAAQLPLASEEGLRLLVEGGVKIGSHTRTHRMLNRLAPAEVAEELVGSRNDLQAHGIPSLPLLAYPHGEHNELVQRSAKEAGFRAAFTVVPGIVHSGEMRYGLPRLEILRADRGIRFWWKVVSAGRGVRMTGRRRA